MMQNWKSKGKGEPPTLDPVRNHDYILDKKSCRSSEVEAQISPSDSGFALETLSAPPIYLK